MYKKIIAIVLALLLALSLCACGKQTYENAPVSGGASASDAVTNNGSYVVQKGNFYYYINSDESVKSTNAFGSTVKGALIRCDLNGGNKVVIQPKLVANAGSVGLFIFGDTIYYTSPADTIGKDGSVQSSYLDIMSCKLDGTQVTKHVTLSANTYKLYFYDMGGAVYCVYADSSSTVKSIEVTSDKPKAETILEKYSSVVFGSDAIFYSVPKYMDKKETIEGKYSEVYTITPDGKTKTLRFTGEGSGNVQYKITLQSAVDGRLYYLKNDSVLTLENALYSISASSFNDEKRCTMSAIASGSFIPYTFNGERGVIITSSTLGVAFVGENGTAQQIYASTLTLSKLCGNTLFYTVTNSTESVDYIYTLDVASALNEKKLATGTQYAAFTASADGEATYDAIYAGNFKTLQVIGNKLFFYSNNDESHVQYLFMYDLTSGARTDLAYTAS